MGWTDKNKEEQEVSFSEARNYASPFTVREDEAILACENGESLRDLERKLGRTFYSLQKRRQTLRNAPQPISKPVSSTVVRLSFQC